MGTRCWVGDPRAIFTFRVALLLHASSLARTVSTQEREDVITRVSITGSRKLECNADDTHRHKILQHTPHQGR